MDLRRWLCVVSAAVAVTLLTTTPALPASKSCGPRGYAYVGLESRSNAFGVAATLTATASALVERGHLARWIGVGAPGEGPHGSDEWLQVGLNTIAGNSGELYYEVAQPGGTRYVGLASSVPAGRRFRVAVLEMAGRSGVWRVWVNGRPASRPIWLPESHGKLTPMAIAESWDGGQPACNLYEYRFGGVSLAGNPGGSWTRFRRTAARVVQAPGARIVPARNGFVAVTAPAPQAPVQPAQPLRPSERTGDGR